MTLEGRRTMTHTRVRARTVLVVALAALAAVLMLVVRTSRAAFIATTENSGNSIIAGDVVITDDDSGTVAMFAATSFTPGETATECIAVRYEGTIADPDRVRLFSGGYTDVGGPDPASVGLSQHVLLTVEEGTGASLGNCGGFTPAATIVSNVRLSTFDATRSDYASGAGTWDPSSTPEVRSYRFSVTLDGASVPNSEQGAGTTDLTFVWEVMS